jgi:hypothetical protein
MALDNVGAGVRALELLAALQHSRHASGLYWTGFVFDRGDTLQADPPSLAVQCGCVGEDAPRAGSVSGR